MADMFKDPTLIRTVIITRPSETSYEIICAAERMAPRNAYFELLAHPASMIPYTAKQDVANKYKIPTLISAMTTPSAKGMTAQAAKLNPKVRIGAKINKVLLAADAL
jgi:hypothetical protein